MPEPPRPAPPANTFRAALSGVLGTGRFANVFWIRNGSGIVPSDAELNSLAGVVWTAYKDTFLQRCTSGTVLEGCQLLFYGGGGLQIGGEHIENSSGQVVTPQLPAQVAIGVSWHIQQRYKGGHPRSYIGGRAQVDMQTETLFTDSICNAIRLDANTFHNTINSTVIGPITDLHLGTVSFVLRNEWRNPPVFRDFTPTAATVDKRIDTQRRRLGRDIA